MRVFDRLFAVFNSSAGRKRISFSLADKNEITARLKQDYTWVLKFRDTEDIARSKLDEDTPYGRKTAQFMDDHNIAAFSFSHVYESFRISKRWVDTGMYDVHTVDDYVKDTLGDFFTLEQFVALSRGCPLGISPLPEAVIAQKSGDRFDS